MQLEQEYAPEPTQEQIDKSAVDGDELFGEVLERAEEMAEFGDSDYAGILFAVWVCLIHALTHMGWTPEDLVKEVLHHGRMASEPESGNV